VVLQLTVSSTNGIEIANRSDLNFRFPQKRNASLSGRVPRTGLRGPPNATLLLRTPFRTKETDPQLATLCCNQLACMASTQIHGVF